MNRLIVCLLVGLACVSGLCQAKVNRDKVQNVLTKLERYALGKVQQVELTIPELEEGFAEFETWDEGFVRNAIAHTPMMQLLIDFLFHPMERFYDLIGDEPDEHAAYIERLAVNYKLFRDSYRGQVVGERVQASPKTSRLIAALFGVNNPKPLTLKMIQEAKIEYEAMAAKVREIPDFEDVYSEADTLLLYRNYVNQPEVSNLASLVFPALGQITEEQLPQLRDYYVEEMKKQNIMVYEGVLTRFVPA